VEDLTLFGAFFMLISYLAGISTLKMEATYSSMMSVDFQRTTWRNMQEDRTLHEHRIDNAKAYKKGLVYYIGTKFLTK
jgi:hypothetical protein